MENFIKHLSNETQKAIQLYFDCENWNSSETLRILKGFSSCRAYHQIINALSCNNENKHGYNGYACNDAEKLIFNYAEGDIFLKICQNENQYNIEKAKTINFYQNN